MTDGNLASPRGGQIDAVIASTVADDGAERRQRIHDTGRKLCAAGGNHGPNAGKLVYGENLSGRLAGRVQKFEALADPYHQRLGELRIDQHLLRHASLPSPGRS